MNAPEARVLDLDSNDLDDTGLRVVGREALAAVLDEDFTAATISIGELAAAGIVAVITSDWTFEVRETLLGWVLAATRGTPDVVDLALAGALRARRLDLQRGTPQ